jgi:hypothetical protein
MTIKRLFLALCCILVSGCTKFDQYVYNCSSAQAKWLKTGIVMGPRSKFGHRPGTAQYTASDLAELAGGRVVQPIRIRESLLRAGQAGEERTEVTNVCNQVRSDVVIVDLD